MVPFTFRYPVETVSAFHRPYVLEGLYACGVRNLVFTEDLVAKTFENCNYLPQLQKEMTEAGLKFVDSHAMFGPRLDLCTGEERDRRLCVQRLNMTFEFLAEIGVDTITVHVGNQSAAMPEVYRPLDQCIGRIEDALSQILPTAEKLGITVCIENIWFPTNTPEVLLGIKEHFPTDALGFCYDAGHANLSAKGYLHPEDGNHGRAWQFVFGKSPEVWDDKIGEKMLPHIVNCHLHDNIGDTDLHHCPGHGNIDWKATADLLRRAPRLKNIQSEVILERDPVSMKHLLDTFRGIFPECFED